MTEDRNHEYANHIRVYLGQKKGNIKNDWRERPIIMDWLEAVSLKDSLSIMDAKVKCFMGKAEGKLKGWFLSGDRNFYSITAERYVMDYLKSKNQNLSDNFSKQGGPDGILHCSAGDIGIEVTTVNGFIADAIFTERLCMYLKEKGYDLSGTCEISYDYDRVNEEIKKRDCSAFYDYIEKVGCNIIRGDSDELKLLNINWTVTNRKSGCIVWGKKAADDFSVIEHLTCRLISALKNKSSQLSKLRRNLVFVGANHCGPTNWLNPIIFREMAGGGISCQCQIDYIQEYLSKNLPQCVAGLCYYIYSLDQDGPFYKPLRVFWRNPNKPVNINL